MNNNEIGNSGRVQGTGPMSGEDKQRVMTRNVLLHGHMFKNAGSSLDLGLRSSFGDGFTDHRDNDAMREGASYLGPYLVRHASLQALSSHWLTFPLPELAEIKVHPVLLFRDPLERSLSVYRFERRQDGDSPGILRARQHVFAEYVRWRLQDGVGPVIRNFHTRYCSGDYHGNDLDTMYTRALATLDGISALGLVDRYDESMVLFEYLLKPIFPELDLSGRAINAGDEMALDYATKRERALSELQPVLDDFIAANEYDLRLHAEVRSRFERALSTVPDFPDRLADMRQRNRAHG